MNGLHLRSLPEDELAKIFEDRWKSAGILVDSDGSFAKVNLTEQLITCAINLIEKEITDHCYCLNIYFFLASFITVSFICTGSHWTVERWD